MYNHKKIFVGLLFLPLFMSFSCSKPKEPYQVHVQTNDEPNNLTVNATLPETLKNGDKLPINTINVKYNNQPLDWLGENNKEFKTDGKFFLVTSSDYPTNSIVTNLVVTTNVERNDLNFYVSYFNKNDETVYISRQLKVTITNDNVIKPWVWYTITAAVIFGVIGMVAFTRYYKNKKKI